MKFISSTDGQVHFKVKVGEADEEKDLILTESEAAKLIEQGDEIERAPVVAVSHEDVTPLKVGEHYAIKDPIAFKEKNSAPECTEKQWEQMKLEYVDKADPYVKMKVLDNGGCNALPTGSNEEIKITGKAGDFKLAPDEASEHVAAVGTGVVASETFKGDLKHYYIVQDADQADFSNKIDDVTHKLAPNQVAWDKLKFDDSHDQADDNVHFKVKVNDEEKTLIVTKLDAAKIHKGAEIEDVVEHQDRLREVANNIGRLQEELGVLQRKVEEQRNGSSLLQIWATKDAPQATHLPSTRPWSTTFTQADGDGFAAGYAEGLKAGKTQSDIGAVEIKTPEQPIGVNSRDVASEPTPLEGVRAVATKLDNIAGILKMQDQGAPPQPGGGGADFDNKKLAEEVAQKESLEKSAKSQHSMLYSTSRWLEATQPRRRLFRRTMDGISSDVAVDDAYRSFFPTVEVR